MKSKRQNPIVPANLTCLFHFDDMWRNVRNGLFTDGSRLFLAHAKTEGVVCGSNDDPGLALSDAQPWQFEEVTVKEVMEWYLRCQPFSTSSTGDLALFLCQVGTRKGGAR